MSRRRDVFVSGTAVALYTAAAFGATLYTGLTPSWACILAAGVGILVAGFAARLVPRVRMPARETTGEAGLPVALGLQERGFFVNETREQREGREIQTALLPVRAPKVEGYHLDVAYQPCGSIGGDLYDFIECSDGRVLVTVGDVSGKGPAGAIVMAMVQTLIRREAIEAKGPADLLQRVNDGFAGTLRKGIFVTALVGVLDPRAHRFTLAGAGHHPLLLLNAGERRTTNISARGLALGLVRGEAFANAMRETTIDIAPGDSLLLYTDGVTECADHIATGVGEHRFLAAAAAAVIPGPRDALKRLDQDLWQGGGRRDDTTLVLVSRLAGTDPDPRPTDRSTGSLTV